MKRLAYEFSDCAFRVRDLGWLIFHRAGVVCRYNCTVFFF